MLRVYHVFPWQMQDFLLGELESVINEAKKMTEPKPKARRGS